LFIDDTNQFEIENAFFQFQLEPLLSNTIPLIEDNIEPFEIPLIEFNEINLHFFKDFDEEFPLMPPPN